MADYDDVSGVALFHLYVVSYDCDLLVFVQLRGERLFQVNFFCSTSTSNKITNMTHCLIVSIVV